MHPWLQDLRYALRGLRSARGYAGIAILTLALGIGATTAIVSVINAVLLKPLPYREPGGLVTLEHLYPSLDNLQAPVSAMGYRDYQQLHQVFANTAVEGFWTPNLTGDGDPERIVGTQVAGDLFGTLGVAPQLGRWLLPDEGAAGTVRTVVLAHSLWQRRFGGDSAIVGRSILLDGEGYEVVGVMPASFRNFWSRRAEFWVPLTFLPRQLQDDARTNEYLNFTGRLAAGVTPEQAQSELTGFARRLVADYAGAYPSDWSLKLTTFDDRNTAGVRGALYLLLGAVGLVLLIACANVANLQLARAAARGREIAVRVALGASPGALMRQLLTESVVLALAGGALGLLLALWGVPALLALGGNNLPPVEEIRIDGLVLGFTFAVSIVTGLLFGLAPALQVVRASLHETLKEGGRGSAGERSSLALRRGLVVATVALALTLLAGAGLLVRSFGRLLAVDPGFRPDHLLTFQVNLPAAKYSNDTLQIAGLERLVNAVRAVPGVTAVAGTSNIPFAGNWSTSSFTIEGYQTPDNVPGPWGDARIVTPEYFHAIGAELKAGRFFTGQDRLGGRRVVIVDETLAARYWPGQDPLGKRLSYDFNSQDSTATWLEVVGVVGHTLHEGLDAPKRVQVYRPLAQTGIGFLGLVVRTDTDPLALTSAVRQAVRSVDADLPLSNVNSMEDLIARTTGPRRFAMLLLATFSGLAAVLASVGLYGVMSFLVTQRARELGVRLALGARAADVLSLVLRQGMRLALAGVAIGLVAALSLGRLLTGMLYQVSSADPLTYLVIPVLLLLVALAATWIPARRATRVDPALILREE